MPAKHVPAGFRRGAGIQTFLLDSRQKHAGMTRWDNGQFILWSGTKNITTAESNLQPKVATKDPPAQGRGEKPEKTVFMDQILKESRVVHVTSAVARTTPLTF